MARKLDVSALAAKAQSGNNSSVRRIEAYEIDINNLVLEEPFRSLFIIREEIKSAIKSHIQEHGYDESKPVDVWKRPSEDGFDYVLVDGFTRTQAAREAGRLTVTAYLHAFASVEEAREYAIHTQRDRRNMSDAELMSVLSLFDKKVTGFKGDSPLAPSGANGDLSTKTAQRTAREIGTSVRKVERARKISSVPDIAGAVRRGEISINKGYNQIRAKEREAHESADVPPSAHEMPRAELVQEAKPTAETIDLDALIARLHCELGVEVSLSLDGAEAACHLILFFVSHNQFAEIVEKICAPRASTAAT